MGFTPQQVDQMYPDQFFACLNGYAAAHGGQAGKSNEGADISDDRLKALGVVGF